MGSDLSQRRTRVQNTPPTGEQALSEGQGDETRCGIPTLIHMITATATTPTRTQANIEQAHSRPYRTKTHTHREPRDYAHECYVWLQGRVSTAHYAAGRNLINHTASSLGHALHSSLCLTPRTYRARIIQHSGAESATPTASAGHTLPRTPPHAPRAPTTVT